MPLFGELRRRNIFKVSLAYVLLAWLIVQFVAVFAPHRAVQILSVVLILGFPVLVLLSWIYELTPDGLKQTTEVDQTQSITPETGRKLNNIVVALLLLAAAVVILQQFLN